MTVNEDACADGLFPGPHRDAMVRKLRAIAESFPGGVAVEVTQL